MEEIIITCDICNKIIDTSNWEDKAGALYIKHSQSSQNILKNLKNAEGNFQRVEIKLNDLCYDCQRKTSNALSKMITDLKREREGVILCWFHTAVRERGLNYK